MKSRGKPANGTKSGVNGIRILPNLIAGRPQPAASVEAVEVRNPATDEVLARVRKSVV